MKKTRNFVKVSALILCSLIVIFLLFILIVYLTNKDSIQRQIKWNSRLENAKNVLQEAGSYDTITPVNFPDITYQSKDDPDLMRVADFFDIKTIAGNSDEISQIKNIMFWVHDNIKYDGSQPYSGQRNSIDLYEYAKETGDGINCRMMSTVLNELYLAAGFKSRFVTCMPKDSTDVDAHVINSVWSDELGKWLWMDASFNAYVSDEYNNLLSIEEVREKLINNETLVLNDEAQYGSGIEHSHYLNKYMAKNLYWLGIKSEYLFNTESPSNAGDISLIPVGYTIWEQQAQWYPYQTHNAKWFWQPPTQQEDK